MNTGIRSVLRDLGWQELKRSSIGELKFSQLWQTSDPLPLLIVQESINDPRAIKDFVRRVENLAWTLHAHHNRRLLTAILLVSGDLDPQTQLKVQNRLSRFCKLIVIPSPVDPAELPDYLGSLNRKLGLPIPNADTTRSTPVRGIISNNPLHKELQSIQEQCRTPDDVSNALQNELQRRVTQVLDALT
jgi:hypothetical protein